MTRPLRWADTFCCIGGVARGLTDAEHRVVIGVDISPDPKLAEDYLKSGAEEFLKGDALVFLRSLAVARRRGIRLPADIDAIWASPPCQFYPRMSNCRPDLAAQYPDLIGQTRDLLLGIGLPYVIENVTDAAPWMRNPVMLCSFQTGRPMYRERLFECGNGASLPAPPAPPANITAHALAAYDLLKCPEPPRWQNERGPCQWPHPIPATKSGHWEPGHFASPNGHEYKAPSECAFGIDWVRNRDYRKEAVPPAMAEWIGRNLIISGEPAVSEDAQMISFPNRAVRAAILSRVSDDRAGTSRSVPEETRLGRLACREHGWETSDRHIYEDESISASRFTTKERPAWLRLRRAIANGAIEILIMWEQSRGSRNPTDWLPFLAECRQAGVKIFVTKDEELFDMGRAVHWKRLATESIDSAYESEKTSERVRRSLAGNREAGRPHGPVPFGYARRYDPQTRQLAEQYIVPGQAAVVREIIGRVAEGDGLTSIAADLNRRGVAPPNFPLRSRHGTGRWTVPALRGIAANPAYIARTPRNPKMNGRRDLSDLAEAIWPAIVEDERVFWSAVRVLTDPARRNHGIRPGRARHLLTYVARCGRCQAPMTALRSQGRWSLCCAAQHHLATGEADADAYVTDEVLARLEVLAGNGFTGGESREVAYARAEAAEIADQLRGFVQAAARGSLSAETLAAVEAEMRPKLIAAREHARLLAVPGALHPFLGASPIPGVWAGLSVAARKAALREITATIVIEPTGRGSRDGAAARIAITWKEHGG